MTGLAVLGLALAVTTGGAPAAVSDDAALAVGCLGCHAGDTALDDRDAATLFDALVAWRDGDDDAALMTRIARGFTPEELRAVAGYLAAR